MKITIAGAGAMGCRFGAALAGAGAEVTLYDAWREHIEVINGRGLCLLSGGEKRYLKIKATADIRMADKPDSVIIFTKSLHTGDAVTDALQIMGPDTPVATFQNGLGNIDVLERAVGRNRVIAGITNYPADLLGPGVVRVDGNGYTRLMALGATGEKASGELCALLKASGMNCELSDDMMREIWEKLAFNNAMNTVTSLTKQRVGYAGGSPYGFELCSLIAREVCDVANAEGVGANYDAVIAALKKSLGPFDAGNHLTSMLQDVLNRRATEIDSISGAVIKRAAKKGIATPRLETVYNLIKIIEENYGTQVSRTE